MAGGPVNGARASQWCKGQSMAQGPVNGARAGFKAQGPGFEARARFYILCQFNNFILRSKNIKLLNSKCIHVKHLETKFPQAI